MDQESMHGQQCKCVHHTMVPLFIVLLGLVFLLGALDVLNASTVAILWPIAIIAAGLTKLCERWCRCC